MIIRQRICGVKLSKNFNTINAEECIEFNDQEGQDMELVEKATDDAYDRCIKRCQAQFEKLI